MLIIDPHRVRYSSTHYNAIRSHTTEHPFQPVCLSLSHTIYTVNLIDFTEAHAVFVYVSVNMNT